MRMGMLHVKPCGMRSDAEVSRVLPAVRRLASKAQSGPCSSPRKAKGSQAAPRVKPDASAPRNRDCTKEQRPASTCHRNVLNH